MKKNNGYKINFADSTITVNYKFAAAMNDADSEEYKIYKEIMTDFPQLRLSVKSGRVQTKPRYNKSFSYANMEKFISTFDNADELEQRFKLVQEKSKILASPYKYVCDWFKAQFPDYKEVPNTITKREGTIVLNAPDAENYAKKAA